MKARRARGREIRHRREPETRDEADFGEAGEPMLPRKTPRQRPGARTKTDTGGRVENTEAIGRTVVKELGIMAP